MKKLVGTEEQIAFANDCLDKFYQSIAEIKAKTPNYNQYLEEMQKQVDEILVAAVIIDGYYGNTDRGILPTKITDWKSAFSARKNGENIIIKIK